MYEKSDFLAKKAVIKELEIRGYTECKTISKPADIIGYLNDERYYFEVKMTRKKEKYFGAATLTEWEQAIKDPKHFYFVVVIQNNEIIEKIIFYKPEEFIKISSIPPFKVYFNLDLNKGIKDKNKITFEQLKNMIDFYHEITKS